jgi:glycosyltransferase involved in cell wall biosynthesis
VVGTVVFVLKGYPRLSEAFIAQEILALERRGLNILIASLRRPTDPRYHPIHAEIRAPVRYLPESLLSEPGRVLAAWWTMRRRPEYGAVRRLWRHDLRRQPTWDRVLRFAQALVLTYELPADVIRLHAHFLHTPASVTRYASGLSGRPWSCSAHARDIWTTPDWEISEKLEDLDWLTVCTEVGRNQLATLASAPERIELAYHGQDFDRFPPSPAKGSHRDGNDENDPVVILSVGRAVEKKGFDVLLRALARLPGRLHWRFVHIGGGIGLPALQRQADTLGLGHRITWMGPQAHDTVFKTYRAADLFVLPCRIAGDGDRDGLPNVLVEAQSQGLACVSTRVSAVSELIEDGVNGLLAAPDDEMALAGALERLIIEHALRARLGRNGCERVRTEFSHERGIDQLMARFNAGTPDPQS